MMKYQALPRVNEDSFPMHRKTVQCCAICKIDVVATKIVRRPLKMYENCEKAFVDDKYNPISAGGEYGRP